MTSNSPSGEDFFLLFRMYGRDKPFYEKTRTVPEFEKVR